MKILITTDLYTTATNGVVTSVRNLCDELTKKGHEVRVLTLSETTHSYKNGNVYYIRSMPIPVYPDVRMPLLTYRHRLVKEIEDWRPDVIHSQCEFFSYRYAAYLSKKFGIPIIHTFHTLYEQYTTYVAPGKRLGRAVVKDLVRVRLKKVDCIVAPTHKVKEALHRYGLDKDIYVMPTGIDLERHQTRLDDSERLKRRRELGFADGEILLIYLGRLGHEKRTDELISYFENASKGDPRLRFMIVGGGPAKEELEKQSQKLGLSDKVYFAGMVEPTRVSEYYQLGDIFVCASTSEAQGLTYVEAAANGLPLLCREDPCLIGVIEQGENGYTYTNEAEFIEKLSLMANDPEWRASAGEKSREIAQGFSKSAFGDSAERIYKERIGTL